MDLRISQISEMTGLSMRYWQRRAMAGELEGARYLDVGNRRIYLVDRDQFTEWWSKQLREVKPCLKTSARGGRSGGSGSPRTGLPTKGLSRPQTLDSLKSALKESVKG